MPICVKCNSHIVSKIPNKYSQKLNCVAPFPISIGTHVSVSDLYIPTIGPQTQNSKVGRPIGGIYKSLTDTWMQKFGKRPCSFISRNICFEFSVQCIIKSYWPTGAFPCFNISRIYYLMAPKICARGLGVFLQNFCVFLGEINSGYMNDNQSLAGSRKSMNLQPVMLMPHGPGDMDRY